MVQNIQVVVDVTSITSNRILHPKIFSKMVLDLEMTLDQKNLFSKKMSALKRNGLVWLPIIWAQYLESLLKKFDALVNVVLPSEDESSIIMTMAMYRMKMPLEIPILRYLRSKTLKQYRVKLGHDFSYYWYKSVDKEMKCYVPCSLNLLLSGDIEANPGPSRLANKRTKRMRVKLLFSPTLVPDIPTESKIVGDKIMLDSWSDRDDECIFQEQALARNIVNIRQLYEDSVLYYGDFMSPRDSFNRWIMRTIINHYDGYNFQADEQLLTEIVSAAPYPFFWVDNPKQFVSYVYHYGEALKKLNSKRWLHYDMVKEFIWELSNIKYGSLSDKIDKLKLLRAKVSSSIRPSVERWAKPLIDQMRRDLFDLSPSVECSMQVPDKVLSLYNSQECVSNYFLYTSLMGDRGKGYHIRVSHTIYRAFGEHFIEGYASPLNRVKARYHSIFASDRRYGSLGSVFSNVDIRNSYLLNPPFMDDFILDMFERFSKVHCAVCFLSANSTNVQLVEQKCLSYFRISKDKFPYEQLFDLKSVPGDPVPFYFIEDTLIVYWGEEKAVMQVETLIKHLFY